MMRRAFPDTTRERVPGIAAEAARRRLSGGRDDDRSRLIFYT
jgi:hypothetical protein